MARRIRFARILFNGFHNMLPSLPPCVSRSKTACRSASALAISRPTSRTKLCATPRHANRGQGALNKLRDSVCPPAEGRASAAEAWARGRGRHRLWSAPGGSRSRRCLGLCEARVLALRRRRREAVQAEEQGFQHVAVHAELRGAHAGHAALRAALQRGSVARHEHRDELVAEEAHERRGQQFARRGHELACARASGG